MSLNAVANVKESRITPNWFRSYRLNLPEVYMMQGTGLGATASTYLRCT